jgi:hypothetical protein
MQAEGYPRSDDRTNQILVDANTGLAFGKNR